MSDVHTAQATNEEVAVSEQRSAGAFESALKFAQRAKQHRAHARMIRGGASVYGWTLGQCEKSARRSEALVRSIANWAIREAA